MSNRLKTKPIKGGVKMTLVRWRPSRDMMNIHDDMYRVFDRLFSKDSWSDEKSVSRAGWYPIVDISENNDEYVLNAELPGLKKDEIQISFTDGILRLEGERKKDKEEKGTDYHRVERSFGKFCRTFRLPNTVKTDKISADFKDGILNIRLPKVEEVKPKEIEVKIS
jgi:HSP20 family protein